MHRFIESIEKNEAGCWIWKRKKDPDGYGEFKSGKVYRAHRWSYTQFVGPIEKGLLVCHKCDVKSCVNPSHLFLGTDLDNYNDAVDKGKAKRKLTESQVRDIRKLRAIGVSRRKLAESYGVNEGTIQDIDKRVTWKWVEA